MAANDPLILKRNAGDTGFEEVSGAASVRDALGASGGVFPRNLVAASEISDVTNLQTTLDTLVVGPASATDNAIVRFDGTTGKLTQDSGITISDVASSNVSMTAPASTDFTFSATGGLFQIFRAGNAAFRWFPANSGTAGSTAYMMSGGTNTSSSGTNVGISLTPTINSSGTAANIDLLVNRTQTSVGSGEQLLMDLRVGGVSRVKVSSAGVVTSSVSTGTAPFAVASTTRVANLNVARAGVADALTGYTVATLPAGTIGDVAYVTDATAPTYLGTLTGGGSVVCPVFYNGSAWVSH